MRIKMCTLYIIQSAKVAASRCSDGSDSSCRHSVSPLLRAIGRTQIAVVHTGIYIYRPMGYPQSRMLVASTWYLWSF